MNRKIIWGLILVILLIPFILFGIKISSQVFVTFTADSSISDELGLYWYSMDAENPYSEKYSVSVAKTDYKNRDIIVGIPRESLKYLRIDLGDNAGEWTISDLKVINGIYCYSFDEYALSDNLGYQNCIQEFYLEDDSVQIVTDGTDGYFVLKNLDEEIQESNNIVNILLCISIMLLFYIGLCCVINISYKVYAKDKELKTLWSKITFFIMLIIDSLLLSLIWDRIILTSLYNLIKGKDILLVKYLKLIEVFSVDRLFFWVIFIGAILLCLKLGLEKSFKYRYIIALIMFIYLVVGQYHGSSIGFLSSMLTEHTEEYERTTLLGINQGLRGDDWAVWVPLKIAQYNDGFDYYNDNLMIEGCDTTVGGRLPSFDLMTVTRQKNWGYLFLPLDCAVSFEWWICLFLVFLSSIDMMYEITSKKKWSLFYGLLITFSPCVQWWNSLWVLIYTGQYFIVALSRFLKSEKYLPKAGWSILAAISAVSFIFDLYPAWEVPFAYVFLVIGIFILWKNKDRKLLCKSNIIGYLFVLGIIGLFAWHFCNVSMEAMLTQLGTTYPGAGQWKEVPADMALLQIINFFMAFGKMSEYSNNCEISQFLSLFVFSVIYIMCGMHNKKIKNNKGLILGLFACAICFLFFMYGPRIPLLHKITLMSFTYPARVYVVFGYCAMVLLVLIFSESEKEKIVQSKTAARITLFSVVVVFLFALFNEKVQDFFSDVPFLACSLFALISCWGYVGYVLLTGEKCTRGIALLTVITILSSICVNPIGRGLDDFSESSLVQAVFELEKENDEQERWLVSGNTTIANIITACGIKRTSGTYYYPDFDMMQLIDPNCEYIDDWNRYAHINMRLGEEVDIVASGASLSVTIDEKTAEALDVGYLVTNEEPNYLQTSLYELQCLYKDETWRIYKVEYR